MEKSIFDTGFLYAYLDEKDSHHADCAKSFRREAINALLLDVYYLRFWEFIFTSNRGFEH